MRRYVDYLKNDEVAIFMFHGVIPKHQHNVRNYLRIHIDQKRFENVLDDLCQVGEPISMDQFVEASIQKNRDSIPPRSFIITFDDGFANNYLVAAPVLKRRKIPATFYLTSNFVDKNLSSWTDRLEYIFEKLDVVEIDGNEFEGTYKAKEEKIMVLERLRQKLKSDRYIDPFEYTHRLWQKLGISEFHSDPYLDTRLSWQQVKEMAHEPLFTIGGHGHTHQILSFLNSKEIKQEIKTSIDLIERASGKKLLHYAYPEGLEHCFSQNVINALKDYGIVSCPTAITGTNRVGDDLFRLKRIMVT